MYSPLNKQYTKGFATEIGGRTSHSQLARSLEIPAVVGVADIMSTVTWYANSRSLKGKVLANPDEETIAKCRLVKIWREVAALKEFKDKETNCYDHHVS